MAKTFHLTIAKVGENLFDAEARSVTLPGVEGVFEVLAGHEPLVSSLVAGEIRVKVAEEDTRVFPIASGGIAEISGTQATVLL